ncbi:phage major tail protein, TP901-1 family [Alkalihalobacillus trypoxylicola]|uniref:Phage major tail protein n=1 Tax=Alkalihalobacillus trypoxylicola TaxID=519424 RepID=A0A162F6N5_9BACI|nr:phage major tail protein, TP901-1 family [Alkalihalobacillus trypoxylicola]KYG34910.1 phage major tail protein [Alkalihalobacillus trypoxylicola]
MAFEDNLYCDFTQGAAQAVAGKDIVLAVFDSTGSDLLAIAGQQGLTINRSADSIEVTSKDTKGGWKSKIAGMKEWSIDNDGLYVADHASHKALSKAFNDGEFVCLKVINQKTRTGMFGGLAILSDYSLEAPFDDAMTYSASFEGNGGLVDLTDKDADRLPDLDNGED